MTRIIIFANGILNYPELLKAQLRPSDRIFCADGGTRHALLLGLTPDVIVGDLDSLPPEIVSQMEAIGVSIHNYPSDKDKTDLELTLEMAVAAQPEEIIVVSALGGRLDQMLGNILLLAQPKYASIRLSLLDGPQQATVLRGHQSITVKGQPGDTLSLIPLSATVDGVTISGVVWPLSKATITFSSTWTMSNRMKDRQATVKIGQGTALVIHSDKNSEDILRR